MYSRLNLSKTVDQAKDASVDEIVSNDEVLVQTHNKVIGDDL